MELEQIIQLIKKDFPKQSIEISESLELLKETISDTMNAIDQKMSDAFRRRDFTTRREYESIAVSINSYENRLEEFISMLTLDEGEMYEVDVTEFDVEDEKKAIPDYAAYTVDNNVEHTLYENFTHIRPDSFKFINNEKILVKTWIDVLLETSEILVQMDDDKFRQFEHNPQMNGKKSKYISSNPDGMRKPRLLKENLYLETNMSGNGIRNLLLKMLKAYGFKATDYKVYFRADYSELNQ